METNEIIIDKIGVEYKIKTKDVLACVENYRLGIEDRTEVEKKYNSLWPKNYRFPSIAKMAKSKHPKIPDTVTIPVYFMQSHKNENGNSIEEYNLTRLILMELGKLRSDAKKEMAKSAANHDEDGKKRFNALQNAFKIVSNSFYGVMGASSFSGYDPDVAGAITWVARNTVGELTDIINSNVLYVTQNFIDANKSHIDEILKLGDPSLFLISKLNKSEYSKINRRLAMASLFDRIGNIKNELEIFEIRKPVGQLIYQDTDSNYYIIRKVQQFYLGCDENGENLQRCDPSLMKNLMETMIHYNEIYANFFEETIKLSPMGVSFEGSFVVARHLNRKKKYMGKKGCDDNGKPYSDKIDPKAYDENGFLVEDYDKYWSPYGNMVPMSDGTYIKIDDEKLIRNQFNYFDYVGLMGIKCTGVDLVRRDQYRFINYFHLLVLKNDLQCCKFDQDSKSWLPFDISKPMYNTVLDLLSEFMNILKKYSDIAALISDEKPSIMFQLEDFVKLINNNGTKNAAKDITDRLKRENKNEYIVDLEVRYAFVVVSSEDTTSSIITGKAGMPTLKNLRWTRDELIDSVKSDFPIENFNQMNTKFKDSIDYDLFITANCISRLYHKHYLSKLASALSLYVFGDLNPDLAKQIDEGLIEKPGPIIDREKERIAKTFVEHFFPSGRAFKSEMKKLTTNLSGGTISNLDLLQNENEKKIESLFEKLNINGFDSPFIISPESIATLERLYKKDVSSIRKYRGYVETYIQMIKAKRPENLFCKELVEIRKKTMGSEDSLMEILKDCDLKLERWRLLQFYLGYSLDD